MGKNQSASGLTNVIQYSNGNITFVSGSTTLMSISSSGAITTTGVISGSNVLTASYANNAELLDGLDSTAFATTGAYSATSGSLYTVSSSAYATSGSLSTASGSFNTRVSALEATGSALSSSILSVSSSAYATSGSLSATSGSLSAASGSFNTRVSALEVTGSALSSSILSVSSSAYATSGSLSAASGSFNTRVASLETYSTNLTAKTASFATTGSNTFIGSQVVSGSLTASGSITATGTITAQTLVVQTITSSVVYSSGSNVFGNDIGNSQRFTGSVLITGSLTIAGASSATSYSGTTIYGSTAVCSPVGKFTTCLDLGGALTGTSATFSGNGLFGGSTNAGNPGTFSLSVGLAGTTAGGIQLWAATNHNHYIQFGDGTTGGQVYAGYIGYAHSTDTLSIGTATADRLTIASTGAATFISTITGTTIYGSTAVCSAVGYFSGCVGIGTINPGTKLEVYRCETDRATVTRLLTLNNNSVANPYDGFGMGILFKGTDYSNAVQCYGAIDAVMEFSNRSTPQPDTGFCARMAFSTGTNGALTERMRISSGGNVGIGTCSPCAKLHINGSTGASTYKGFAYTYAGSETLINEVLFQAVVGGYSSNLPIFLFKDERSDQGTTQRIFEIQGGRSGVGTILTTLASGNVGIGTSVPDSKLHICNAIAGGTNNYLIIVQNCCTVSDSRAGIAFSNNSQTPSAGGLSGASIQTSNNGIDGAGNLLFSTLISGTNCERMRITSAGNVGIGTCNPSYKLDIAGTAYVNGSFLADSMRTLEGSVSNPYNVWTTMFTVSTNTVAIYYVIAVSQGNGLTYTTSAMVVVNDGGVGLHNYVPAGALTLQTSGYDVQVKNGSGSTMVIRYKFIKMA